MTPIDCRITDTWAAEGVSQEAIRRAQATALEQAAQYFDNRAERGCTAVELAYTADGEPAGEDETDDVIIIEVEWMPEW